MESIGPEKSIGRDRPAWLMLKPVPITLCHEKGFFSNGGETKAEVFSKELEETAFRYLPYVARAKQMLLSSHRYVAYSSDVGESLRPVIKPWQVNLSYGIAGAYVLADTSLAGYRRYQQEGSREEVAAACAHTAVFQTVASLALPAVIIHTCVHQSQHLFDTPRFASMPRVGRYGPSAVGLAIIPFMPLLDPPCEHVIDALFDRVWPAWRHESHSSH
eukprot:symbB.v1.2.036580.t1/scaffold5197.1/size29901/3